MSFHKLDHTFKANLRLVILCNCKGPFFFAKESKIVYPLALHFESNNLSASSLLEKEECRMENTDIKSLHHRILIRFLPNLTMTAIPIGSFQTPGVPTMKIESDIICHNKEYVSSRTVVTGISECHFPLEIEDVSDQSIDHSQNETSSVDKILSIAVLPQLLHTFTSLRKTAANCDSLLSTDQNNCTEKNPLTIERLSADKATQSASPMDISQQDPLRYYIPKKYSHSSNLNFPDMIERRKPLNDRVNHVTNIDQNLPLRNPNRTNAHGNPYTTLSKLKAHREIFQCGSKLYKKQNKERNLPSYSTLCDDIKDLKFLPGIDVNVFSRIEFYFKNKSNMERDCSLVLDETGITPLLVENKVLNKLTGYITLPESTDEIIADKILVVMIRGIAYPWKLAIAYHFTDHSLKAVELKPFIEQIITELERIGIRVRIVVSDQATCNTGMWKQFGMLSERDVSISNPSDPKRKIYFIPDLAHLDKNLRNSLQSSDLETVDGEILSFGCIRELNDLQKDSSFPIAEKLSNRHIEPDNQEKMKVSLAAQAMSNSVGAALQTIAATPDIKTKVDKSIYISTAAFIHLVNLNRDIVNNRTRRFAINKNFPDIAGHDLNLMEAFRTVLCTSKFLENRPYKPVQIGYNRALTAIPQLVSELLEEGYRYVLLAHFLSDCIENFFGLMRTKFPGLTVVDAHSCLRLCFAGHFYDLNEFSKYSNPFTNADRKEEQANKLALEAEQDVVSMLKPERKADASATISVKTNKISSDNEISRIDCDICRITDYHLTPECLLNDRTLPILDGFAFYYAIGGIVHRILNGLRQRRLKVCNGCFSSLTTKQYQQHSHVPKGPIVRLQYTDPNKYKRWITLLKFRQYAVLIKASDRLLDFYLQAELIFIQIRDKHGPANSIKQHYYNILYEMLNTTNLQLYCRGKRKCNLKKILITKFVNWRMTQQTRTWNKINELRKKQRNFACRSGHKNPKFKTFPSGIGKWNLARVNVGKSITSTFHSSPNIWFKKPATPQISQISSKVIIGRKTQQNLTKGNVIAPPLHCSVISKAVPRVSAPTSHFFSLSSDSAQKSKATALPRVSAPTSHFFSLSSDSAQKSKATELPRVSAPSSHFFSLSSDSAQTSKSTALPRVSAPSSHFSSIVVSRFCIISGYLCYL